VGSKVNSEVRKPIIPRKRLWLYLAILSIVAIFVAVYFRSDGIFRGRPPYGVGSALFDEVKPRKPWINFEMPLLGRITFPSNSLPFEIDPDDSDPDSAGLLYAMDGLDIGKWRIGGKVFETEKQWKDGEKVDGNRQRWNATFIPFASSPDARDAEVMVSGDWYPVVLPYKEGLKGPRKTLTFDTPLGKITAEPEPQPNRIANFKARLTSDSETPLLFVGHLDYMREGVKRPQIFLLKKEPKEMFTTRAKPARLVGEVHTFEEVPLKLRLVIQNHIVLRTEYQMQDGSFSEMKRDASGLLGFRANNDVAGRISDLRLPEDGSTQDVIGLKSTGKASLRLPLDSSWP
jgi:hypothetical protein